MDEMDRDGLIALLRSGSKAFNAWRLEHPAAPIALAGATLDGAHLDGVWLMGATLDGADLSRASLRDAVFSGASLVEARFEGADLRGAVFGPPALVDSRIAMSPLGERIMFGAALDRARFAGAQLEGASFRECGLTTADLSGCDLSAVDLRRTRDLAAREGTRAAEGAVALDVIAAEAIEVRRSMMQTALIIAIAGGEVSEEKNLRLGRIALELGIDRGELDDLIPRPIVLDALAIVPATTAAGNDFWMSALLALASTDGSVASHALRFAYDVGERLGYDDDAIAAMVHHQVGITVRPTGR